MEESISVRIPRNELKEIEFILEYGGSTRSNVLREVLEKGIKQKKLEIALEKFQNNEASASKAAFIASIPLTQFLDILQKRGINFHYDIDDLREDLSGL